MCLGVDFATINVSSKVYILCSEDIKNLYILKTHSCYAVYVWPSEKHISLIKGGGTGGGVSEVLAASVGALLCCLLSSVLIFNGM